MRDSIRSPSTMAVAVLAAVAILGYLAGHARTGAASAQKMHTASVAGVLLDYPSDWRPAAAAPVIPGLSLAHPVVLAPGGEAAHAGLLIGQLPAGEPTPLPRQFVARMRWLPDTAVVALLEVQAYRYARLSVPGFDQVLTLYAIPNPAGNPTALACYASAAFSASMRTCERVVAALTLVGQSQSYDLTPEPGYAGALGTSIRALDGQRVALRRELLPGTAPPVVQALATRLAAGFAGAAASIATLEPSSATKQAQATLSATILNARNAYTALAAAAQAENPSLSAAAGRMVSEAETSVNAALENFTLLGYKA
jgi:hypothetical protein